MAKAVRKGTSKARRQRRRKRVKLKAVDARAGSPMLETPTLGQAHSLQAHNLTAGADRASEAPPAP